VLGTNAGCSRQKCKSRTSRHGISEKRKAVRGTEHNIAVKIRGEIPSKHCEGRKTMREPGDENRARVKSHSCGTTLATEGTKKCGHEPGGNFLESRHRRNGLRRTHRPCSLSVSAILAVYYPNYDFKSKNRKQPNPVLKRGAWRLSGGSYKGLGGSGGQGTEGEEGETPACHRTVKNQKLGL